MSEMEALTNKCVTAPSASGTMVVGTQQSPISPSGTDTDETGIATSIVLSTLEQYGTGSPTQAISLGEDAPLTLAGASMTAATESVASGSTLIAGTTQAASTSLDTKSTQTALAATAAGLTRNISVNATGSGSTAYESKLPSSAGSCASAASSRSSAISSDGNAGVNRCGSSPPTIDEKYIKCDKSAENELGTGSYGTVYRGQWDGKTVALKYLNVISAKTPSQEMLQREGRKDTSAEEMRQKKLQHEGRLLWRLRHRNIIDFYGICGSPNAILVMEYARGGSLEGVIRKDYNVHEEHDVCVDWATQIARALNHLHENNCVHRDLTLLNILIMEPIESPNDLREKKTLKICDFGLLGTEYKSTRETSQRSYAILYQAPEVDSTSNLYSKKSDVWSFGVILYVLITNDEIPCPIDTEKIPEQCPPKFKTIIKDCFQSNREDRKAMSAILDSLQKMAVPAEHQSVDALDNASDNNGMDKDINPDGMQGDRLSDVKTPGSRTVFYSSSPGGDIDDEEVDYFGRDIDDDYPNIVADSPSVFPMSPPSIVSEVSSNSFDCSHEQVDDHLREKTPAKTENAQQANEVDGIAGVKRCASSPPTIDIRDITCDKTNENTLGTGSYGVVYRGQWNGKTVALKELKLRLPKKSRQEQLQRETSQEMLQRELCELTLEDKKRQEKLQREGHLLWRLEHSNIIDFYGIVGSPNAILVMEYASGGSLDNVISQKCNLLEDVCVAWASQIASALTYLHRNDCAHRDLTLKNIVIMERIESSNDLRDKTLKICDFGILGTNYGSTRTATQRSYVMAFMAPEVHMRSPGSYSKKSDVYSFGIILWRLLNVVQAQFPKDIHEQFRLKLLTIIKDCLQPMHKDRKAMSEILDSLMKMKLSTAHPSVNALENASGNNGLDKDIKPDSMQVDRYSDVTTSVPSSVCDESGGGHIDDEASDYFAHDFDYENPETVADDRSVFPISPPSHFSEVSSNGFNWLREQIDDHVRVESPMQTENVQQANEVVPNASDTLRRLKKARPQLVKTISDDCVKEIADELMAARDGDGYLTVEQWRNIKTHTTTADKVRDLLDIIYTSGDGSVDALLLVLKRQPTNDDPGLAMLLRDLWPDVFGNTHH